MERQRAIGDKFYKYDIGQEVKIVNIPMFDNFLGTITGQEYHSEGDRVIYTVKFQEGDNGHTNYFEINDVDFVVMEIEERFLCLE